MSTREVLQISPSVKDSTLFGAQVVRMMSSFILDLSNMFTGPFGLITSLTLEDKDDIINLPSLGSLQAYDYKNNHWIVAFLQVCEGALKFETL